MAKDYAKQFYNSKAWKSCKASYIQNRVSVDGGMCEVCHKRIGYIVHHKEAISEQNINNPYITLNHDNLRYECKVCHDAEPDHWLDSHGYKKPRAMFDENGNPISTREIDQAPIQN